MLLTILGLILLLIPFLLVFYFENKTLGFLSVFTGVSFIHLFLALSSQYFHFFNYSLIIAINSIIALAVIIFLIKDRRKISFKIKVNWLALLAALIILFELWSVHYFYTGEISTIYGRQNVVQASYPYPFFSDDWAGVSFTAYSINNNALPITNPLMNGAGDKNFPNIFIGFFAGLAEIFLILDISPLIGFPILSIVSGSLICFLVYLFLKSCRVENLFALLGALCLPWVMCSVNLPGIWNLFPFIGAFILFLISLIALNLKDRRLALISGLLSLFLYPPLIVLIAPTLILEFLFNHKFSWKKTLIIIGGSLGLVLIITGLVFILQKSNWPALISFFVKSLIRSNNQGCIPTRAIWQIIPLGLLPVAAIGFIFALKRKIFPLIIPLTISLLYWAVYAYCPYFLIIDYARVAVAAAYLLMIAVGLGAAEIFKWLKNKYLFLNKDNFRFSIAMIILAIFIALSFFYTRRTNWQNIILKYDTPAGVIVGPIYAPVNNYLNQDDLALFKGISQKRFLSFPWKGLVIGAATNNYPLDSKAGIITNSLMDYDEFIMAPCAEKIILAQNVKLDYVYSEPFICSSFTPLGSSREGLYLYKFKP